MCTRRFYRVPLILLLALLLVLFPMAPAIASSASESQPAPESRNETEAEVREQVSADVESQADEKRERIIQEAVTAIDQTRKAAEALRNEDANEALAALERVTGKLEIILARDPDLALAPMNLAMTTHDIYGTVEAIKRAIEDAEGLLDDGNIQEARRLLEGLASEAVLSVTNIPLATYPDAIKAVVPLIDAGKLEEAREELDAALNTLVVTDHVVPLPPIRAEALLEEAEELAEESERTEAQNERLARLLEDARTELEIAEVLGYHRQTEYDDLYEQLDEIERKTQGGQSGEGFFDAINRSLTEWPASLLN